MATVWKPGALQVGRGVEVHRYFENEYEYTIKARPGEELVVDAAHLQSCP